MLNSRKFNEADGVSRRPDRIGLSGRQGMQVLSSGEPKRAADRSA